MGLGQTQQVSVVELWWRRVWHEGQLSPPDVLPALSSRQQTLLRPHSPWGERRGWAPMCPPPVGTAE